MATNDVLGKLGRSNIKSRGPLLWAEKQPNGSIREVLFLSFSLPSSLSQERENKWKLICIKCLSRQTCPLRGDHTKIPHPARSKRGGGDKVGCRCISSRVCVVLINEKCASEFPGPKHAPCTQFPIVGETKRVCMKGACSRT